jgi:hypothetical protein
MARNGRTELVVTLVGMSNAAMIQYLQRAMGVSGGGGGGPHEPRRHQCERALPQGGFGGGPPRSPSSAAEEHLLHTRFARAQSYPFACPLLPQKSTSFALASLVPKPIPSLARFCR